MNNNFGIFARQDEARRAEEAERRERSNQKRIRRELERFSITGKITRFLEKTAEKNKAVNDAVNQISNPQASVPQISVPAIKGNDVEVKEPTRFGTTVEVPDESFAFEAAFKLFVTTTPPPNQQPAIGVVYGEVNKAAPTNMGSLFFPSNFGILYLNISFDPSGTFISSSVASGSSLPQNTPTRLYVLIGRVLLQQGVYSIDRQAHLGDFIVRRQDICINGDTYVDFAFVGNLVPILNA